MQAIIDNLGLNPQAAPFTPSGLAGLSLPMSPPRTSSDEVMTQKVRLEAEADVSEVEGSKTEVSDAKAIQDSESSGHTDLTATLFSGVVLSGVKDGVAKTDDGVAKTDELGLELNDPKWSEPKRNELRYRCNFEEEGDDDLNLQVEDHDMVGGIE